MATVMYSNSQLGRNYSSCDWRRFYGARRFFHSTLATLSLPTTSVELCDRALKSWHQGSLDDAEQLFERALQDDDNDGADAVTLSHYALFLAREREQFEEASDLLYQCTHMLNESMLAERPDDSGSSSNSAERRIADAQRRLVVCRNVAWFAQHVQEDWSTALAMYDRAVALAVETAAPRSLVVELMCRRAYIYIARGSGKSDYLLARQHYHHILENYDNECIDALIALAFISENVERDFEEANELYNKALEIDPENLDALRQYAIFLRETRHADEKHTQQIITRWHAAEQHNKQ